ncbi:MAG: ribose-phosphate pyrophosphokinase [Clostridia bacterium]|nr:ribose-phosphate pyrophosphokinase [Clostridia bacterium]
MFDESQSQEFNGELGIIALKSCKALGEQIDSYLKSKREDRLQSREFGVVQDEKSYLIDVEEIRFSNGEGKVVIKESVRGKDIFILCDIGNYSCTYDMFGFVNHMGPDEHFQDIKRVVSALNGRARRITVIMPLLYEGRQHRRKGRESLDCALSLQELERLGVNNIVSFDVHDPNVQNAVPLVAFQNLYPTYQIVKNIIKDYEHSSAEKKMIVISPDTGAMDRSIYYSSLLGCDVGLFYKRRDYSKVVNGKNPIVQHEYMGRDVTGLDILIADDMIASGQSVLDIAKELKERKANSVNVATTFGLFTSGIDTFNEYYKQGLIDKVYCTNLTYIPDNVLNAKWFRKVDMSGFLGNIIHHLNFDRSLTPLTDDAGKIKKLIK